MNVLHTDRYSNTDFSLDEGEPLNDSDLLKAHLRTPVSMLHLGEIYLRNILKIYLFLNRNGINFTAWCKFKAIQTQKKLKHFEICGKRKKILLQALFS